uniref:MBL fold metallo-hydrolase n=1 Tax=Pararhizobium sp. IMCC3301 TaxID=3067904 RepID=UPI0027427020|nr:MBL fold metallo-hydrolase [Pararhizobium sp. IMCC3301]
MSIDRREFLAGTCALAAGSIFGAGRSAFAAVQKPLGDGSVTALSDGYMSFPPNFMYPAVADETLDALLARHNLPTDRMEPPCNLTLFRSGERTVLFDVGGGSQFLPTTGKLPEALDAIDLAPQDVTDIIFTHAHPDHLWGLLDDFDELFFSDANYYISEPEWQFWTDPETVNNVRDDQQGLAVGSKRRLEALADRITLFQPESEILSGIYAHDTSGHTPGHCSFELNNGTDQLLVLGDALAHPFITFEHPEWPFAQDVDAEHAIITRKRLLDFVSSRQMDLMGYHLPYPGFGRAERNDTAYRFVTK